MSLSSSIEFEGSIYRNGQKDSATNGFNVDSLPSSTSQSSKNILVRTSPPTQRKRSVQKEDNEEENSVNGVYKPTDRYGFITKNEDDAIANIPEYFLIQNYLFY